MDMPGGGAQAQGLPLSAAALVEFRASLSLSLLIGGMATVTALTWSAVRIQ